MTLTGAAGDPLIHAIGWFDGRYGYNVMTRGLFDPLSRRLPVVASPLRHKSGPVDQDKAEIPKYFPDAQCITVTMLYGSMARVMYNVEGPRVCFTLWESTRLPKGWAEALDRYTDRIWTATPWGKRVFAANGLDPERIDVVPLGIDPDLFRPDLTPTPAIPRDGSYTFLSVGRWEKRKGMADLVTAFDAEFGDTDDVRLVLAGLHANQPDLDLGSELGALGLRRPDRLKIIPPVGRHATFAGIYTACDAFVAPTRAEGWGLPMTEAMACGLPTIVTGYSGPSAFIGKHAYRIDHRLVPVDVPFFETEDGDLGLWAEPDWRHLRHLMRHVYENREEARDRGQAGSAHVRRQVTWDRAADVAAGLLRQMASRL
ncbi:MAG: glycosyltransferase family 4 protein [Thalassobaculaceae bacterium]|nr:glycosyltransferase family 4 protein [Thalassobaculaceae bacterium]